jgi:hypothetical protein
VTSSSGSGIPFPARVNISIPSICGTIIPY